MRQAFNWLTNDNEVISEGPRDPPLRIQSAPGSLELTSVLGLLSEATAEGSEPNAGSATGLLHRDKR